MDRRVEHVLQLNIKIAEILENVVFGCVLEVWLFAEWANSVSYASIAYLNGEIVLCAVNAAAVSALQHRYHLEIKA